MPYIRLLLIKSEEEDNMPKIAVKLFDNTQIGRVLRYALHALMNLRRSRWDEKTKKYLEEARDFFDFLLYGLSLAGNKEEVNFNNIKIWKNFQDIEKHAPVNSMDSEIIMKTRNDIQAVLNTSQPNVELEDYIAVLLRKMQHR
jgi:hypothetical protein